MPVYINSDGSYTQTPKDAKSRYVENLRGFRGAVINSAAQINEDLAARRAAQEREQQAKAQALRAENPSSVDFTARPKAAAEAVGNVLRGAFEARSAPGAGQRATQETGSGGGAGTPLVGTTPETARPSAPASSGSAPPPTTTPSTVGVSSVDNTARLNEMGVPNSAFWAPADQFNDPVTGQQARRQALRAGSDNYLKLGSFGVAGGPNIYGKSSTPGGRIDTFVGAGTGAAPAVTDETGAYVSNGIGTPEQRAQAQQLEQRYADGGRRLGGGAAPGSSVLRQVDAINRRAQNAFDTALKRGLNTKAAARIADNIRGQATDLIGADRNEVVREGDALNRQNVLDQIAGRSADNAANIAAELQSSGLRAQGQINAAQYKELAESRKQFVEDAFTRLDFETGKPVRDPQFAFRVLSTLGLGDVNALSQNELSQRLAEAQPIARLADNFERLTGQRFVDLDSVFGPGGAKYGDGELADVFAPGSRIGVSDYLKELVDQFGFGNAEVVELADGTRVRKDELLRGVLQTPEERSSRLRRRD